MKNALALPGVATLVLLAGCSARASRAATSPPTRAEAQESAKTATDKKEPPAQSGLSSVETTEERREGLEGKLDDSLRDFDGLILREQEILEERREASAPPPGGGGGGAGEGLGEEGEGDEPGAEERTADAAGTGGSPDEPGVEPVDSEDGAPVASDAGELSNGRIPPDVGDGRDDDIVARQLREAAMNEEDPALREKLWDEYRAYKFGTKKKENE